MRTEFLINDRTGCSKIVFYQKSENEISSALKNFNYTKNILVKVYGTIRSFKEEKAIIGNNIKEVTEFNEQTNHFLQVFVAHNMRKFGTLSPSDFA